MSVKRVLLIALATTLTTAAALGVWVLLFETFFGLEEEVFGSLGSLMLFLVPTLTAAVMLERGHWTAWNYTAATVSGVGLLLYLGVVWGDPPRQWGLWKPMIIVAVWAWALPWTAALGFTRLSGRSRYVRVAAMALPMILSTELTIVVLIEEGNEAVARVLGVTAILVVLGTIITPVLQKLAGLSRRDGVQTTKLQLDLTCPRCGLEQRLPSGPSRCGQCRLKFRIDIEEPVCPTCGYVLHQLTQPTCPECGTALAPEEITRVDRSADAESAAEASR